MTGNKVCVVVCEDDIFQGGSSLGDEVPVDEVVISGIDDVGFTIGLDVVSEYGKHFGLELSNIDSSFILFRDELDVGTHCVSGNN